MKARITYTGPYTPALKIGDIVEIVPGCETDAEGIWNAPAGKLVLCKKEDGTFSYASMLHMQIVDYNNTDWAAFRREAAKDLLVAMTRKVIDDPDQLDAFDPDFYARVAVEWADSLIEQLKTRRP